METNRRTFLKQLAGIPVILGLPSLLGAQDGPERPDWLKQALERMKKENKFGVALVVPTARGERRPLGLALEKLLAEGDEGVREIFCEAVFVCVTSVPAAKENEGVVVVDGDGKRVEGARLAGSDLKDSAAFAKKFRPLLHGEKNERVREKAEAIRAKAAASVLEALKKLDSDSADEREAATAVLEKHVETIVPLLVFERLTAEEPERRARLRTVIKGYFEKFDATAPGPRLPYGATVGEISSCTGGDDETPVKCGMANVPDEGRKFLKFLAR